MSVIRLIAVAAANAKRRASSTVQGPRRSGEGETSLPRRHPRAYRPYANALAIVVISAAVAYAVSWIFGVPPLIVFVVATSFCFFMYGVRPGLIAALLSAVLSDLLFLEPLLTLTHHSILLAVQYAAGGSLALYLARRSLRQAAT